MTEVGTAHASAMNTALERKLVAVRALMAKASGDEIRTRYEIATIILSIQHAPDKYGSRGVDKLALALGCDRATLYRYGHVARTFEPKAMRAVLSDQKRRRGSLSWSHLIVLAAVSNKADRLRLLEAAMGGMSVRNLEQQLHADADAESPQVKTAVRRFLAMTETFKSRAMLELDLSTATASEVETLLKSQEELQEICKRNLDAIRTAKQNLDLRKQLATRGERPRRLLAG